MNLTGVCRCVLRWLHGHEWPGCVHSWKRIRLLHPRTITRYELCWVAMKDASVCGPVGGTTCYAATSQASTQDLSLMTQEAE